MMGLVLSVVMVGMGAMPQPWGADPHLASQTPPSSPAAREKVVVVQLRFAGDGAPVAVGEWKKVEAAEGTGGLLQRLGGVVVKRAGKGSLDVMFEVEGEGLRVREKTGGTPDSPGTEGLWELPDFKAMGEFKPAGVKSGVSVGVDLNAWRSALEKRFDAALTGRVLSRLGLTNARSWAVQVAAVAPEAPTGGESARRSVARDGPLRVRARVCWSARSEAPGVVHAAEITSAVEMTEVEKAAVKDAAWVGGVDVSAGGVGMMGPGGGVGSWGGVVRLGVDVLGSLANPPADDVGKWDASYERWKRDAGDELRAVVSRLEPIGIVAGWPSGDGAEVVVIVPAREGVTKARLESALEEFARVSGLKAGKGGVWELAEGMRGGWMPRMRWSVAGGEKAAWLVVGIGEGKRLEGVVGGLEK